VNNNTALAIFAVIAIVAVMVVGMNIIVPISVKASVENPCEHTGKKNPNCFQPPLCNDPSTCLIFEPPGKK
jgi:hypothetical protein